ncbi:hypothetical protein EVAR_47082_1, partial [Eumeta japonica]
DLIRPVLYGTSTPTAWPPTTASTSRPSTHRRRLYSRRTGYRNCYRSRRFLPQRWHLSTRLL